METGRQMLHASVIFFSPVVWGVGSPVSLKIIFKQVPLAEMSFRPAWVIALFSFQMLSFFLPYIHTQFSHTSVQMFQNHGKTIRKVTKSFLILWKCSDFRTKVFLHLFLFQILKQPKKTHLEFNLSLFIQFFVSFSCLCSQRKSGF